MYRVWNFLSSYSLLLIIGAVIALVWANIDHASYEAVIGYNFWTNDIIGHPHHGHRELTLHFIVNDLLMALFFAIAGKEVWEAVILKNGSLRGKKALGPLIATSGGMFGPILVYFAIAAMFGSTTVDAIQNGWAIPTATDIAFSYLIARLIFGAGHPAVGFLLLLAIADDAAGLIIIAVAYPSGDLNPLWLIMSFAAAFLTFLIFNEIPRRKDRGLEDRPHSTAMRKRFGAAPYIIAGIISWFGFQYAGIHPALGLLPVIPAIPHADRAFGIFAAAEKHLTDILNTMEHALKSPVEIVLFFFGLCNAGVVFEAMGPATWAVMGGLLIGKPLGIFVMGWIAAHPLRLGLPEGMDLKDLFLVGTIASIGFTVSLFVSVAAFNISGLSGAELVAMQGLQDAAKMGALFSFLGAVMTYIAAKILNVKPRT